MPDMVTLSMAKSYTDETVIGGGAVKGATFTPSVSKEGVISWTNDKGLDNPDSVNIKGPQGEQGEKGEKGEKGDTGGISDVVVNGTKSVVENSVAKLIVHNTVDSDSELEPLSAKMGKELQSQISNLKNIGRFLSIWDCTTGLPLTDPVEGTPYAYKTGDYYRVGTIAVEGGTNYKPNGSSYDKEASTTVETDTVEIGAVYYYDGDSWEMQKSGAGGKVQDVQIGGNTVLNLTTGVANIGLGDNFSYNNGKLTYSIPIREV